MTDPNESAAPAGAPPLVVGVVPGQPDVVLRTAADFGRDLGAPLVCAYVDVTRYAAEFLPNGFMVTMPIDPDLSDTGEQVFPPELGEQVERLLAGAGVGYSTRVIAGDPADALAQLADGVGARAVVVGTREKGFLASIEQLVNGSVGARLAHRQPRPVIVVPLAPSTEKRAGEKGTEKKGTGTTGTGTGTTGAEAGTGTTGAGTETDTTAPGA